MKKDYHFLIGQRFSAEGEIYVVQELTAGEEEVVLVEASIAAPTAAENSRTFSLRDVIEWLLVDEEIVLFSPDYLATR